MIPRERVKNGQEHDVPLSEVALKLFEARPKIGMAGLMFTMTGDTPASGYSRAKERLDAEILKIQRDEAVQRGENPQDLKPIPHRALHDLRRTGASGMARLGIQLPVIKKILNHTSGTFRGVVGVYQRHSFADEEAGSAECVGESRHAFVKGDLSGKCGSVWSPKENAHPNVERGV